MSEHIRVHETHPNPTAQVVSPAATASPCDDIQCHADHRHQMTREREVEQDTILVDHIPDDQGGCQRPTDSHPSCCGPTSLHFEQGDIDVCCGDSNCSEADVSCTLNSPSKQSHSGSAAESDCSGHTLKHVSGPEKTCHIITGSACDITGNTSGTPRADSELDGNCCKGRPKSLVSQCSSTCNDCPTQSTHSPSRTSCDKIQNSKCRAKSTSIP
ncbi:hypothetical protein BJY52DRAFT_681150 [Lactarius psammicola]|nr:hypothetical protein BJY52DRAFT_681150 [Lactarius psammicola]